MLHAAILRARFRVLPPVPAGRPAPPLGGSLVFRGVFRLRGVGPYGPLAGSRTTTCFWPCAVQCPRPPAAEVPRETRIACWRSRGALGRKLGSYKALIVTGRGRRGRGCGTSLHCPNHLWLLTVCARWPADLLGPLTSMPAGTSKSRLDVRASCKAEPPPTKP